MPKVTEFQPAKGGGVVTDNIDTKQELIDLIKYIVSEDGLELSQIRLCEILVKMVQLSGGLSAIDVESGLYVNSGKIRLGTNPLLENVILDGVTLRSFTFQNLIGFYLKGLVAKTGETKILWIDNVTGKVALGDPPSSGSSYIEYDATNGVRVWASAVGVTAEWLAGELTVTIPIGVHLQSFRVGLVNGANVQSGADDGGATNWIRIRITGTTGYNTSFTNMKVPSIQKVLYASGAPGLANAYSVDLDNNPNVAVVGVASNSITIRIWNLIVPNGAQFTFNGI